MPITDLTGYTWIANQTILTFPNVLSLYGSTYPNGAYDIEAITNTSEFGHNGISFYGWGENTQYFFMYLSETLQSVQINGWTYATQQQLQDYASSAITTQEFETILLTNYKKSPYIAFHITGGDDVTNSTVITWLQTNGTLVQPTVTYDLSQLAVGTHQLTVKANATGLPQSEASSPVINYSVYSVTKQLTGCSVSAGDINKLGQDGTATLTISPTSGWVLPDSISISGIPSGSYTWTKATGTLVISNPNGAVTITITAIQQLPAPTITMSGGVISFDPITGADTYQVFAGNTSIGEVSA